MKTVRAREIGETFSSRQMKKLKKRVAPKRFEVKVRFNGDGGHHFEKNGVDDDAGAAMLASPLGRSPHKKSLFFPG